MKSAKLTTETGFSWITSINGTDQEIQAYFLNQFLDVGKYPVEKMERVIKVEIDS